MHDPEGLHLILVDKVDDIVYRHFGCDVDHWATRASAVFCMESKRLFGMVFRSWVIGG